MDINVYLLLGIALSLWLAWRANIVSLVAVCGYWLAWTLWALGVIQPWYLSTLSWLNLLDINISYQTDGLARLFTLLISGIGIMIFIYAYLYMFKNRDTSRKLMALLQLFAISMLSLVIANDLIQLFLCWELTSITSYLLIQFDNQDNTANQAAFNSLFVSVLGSLLLLVGFIELNTIANTWAIDQLLTQRASLLTHPKLPMILVLVLAGVTTKSAQFPWYFWLVGAMKAPTPVSAYLHSATMVNAGIYLLARFHPLFSELSLWYTLLASFGMTTMLLSSLFSIMQDDLKALLAYTTVFALGAMVYLAAGSHSLTIEALTIFLLFHGVYKAGAFMLVGVIDKEYGTRNIYQLAGIAKSRPLLAITLLIIFSAMAGLPPLFGFTMKEIILEAKLATASVYHLLISLSIISSILIAAASLRCIWLLLKPIPSSKPSIAKFKFGLLGPILCSALIIVFSLIDDDIRHVIEPAILSILPDSSIDYSDPSSTISFTLSLITVLGGFTVLASLLFTPFQCKFKLISLREIFEQSVNGVIILGKYLTHYTQAQSLTRKCMIILATLACIFILTLQPYKQSAILASFTNTPIHFWISYLLLILAASSLIVSRRFLNNLISLSLVGIATSFIFINYGAVDVAITQLLVEVLLVIIFLLTFKRTMIHPHTVPTSHKLLKATIAVVFGTAVTQFLIFMREVPFNTELQDYFIANSLSSAYGRNVVNVILVDFRSLDTFGEVIVILITAIAIAILFNNKRKKSCQSF